MDSYARLMSLAFEQRVRLLRAKEQAAREQDHRERAYLQEQRPTDVELRAYQARIVGIERRYIRVMRRRGAALPPVELPALCPHHHRTQTIIIQESSVSAGLLRSAQTKLADQVATIMTSAAGGALARHRASIEPSPNESDASPSGAEREPGGRVNVEIYIRPAPPDMGACSPPGSSGSAKRR